MKRLTLCILTSAAFAACNNNPDNKNVETIAKADSVPKNTIQQVDTINKSKPIENEIAAYRDSSLAHEFKQYKIYTVTDTIKADLNGDKISDAAYFINKKEITIVDGKTGKPAKVGLDKSFGDMGNDFSWVDFWATTEDKETYEIVIKDDDIIGDRKTKLDNTSIIIRKDEVGGGVITFKKGKYIWLHQSD